MDTGSGPEGRQTRTSQAVVRPWLWTQSSPEPLAAVGCSEPPHGTPCGLHFGPVTLEGSIVFMFRVIHEDAFAVIYFVNEELL